MALCPGCKAPNPAPVKDLALTQRLAEATIAEAAAERRASRGVRIAGFVAFALSLLTVVPALVLMWITAKRWGRVPFALIAVDVVIMTIATYGTRLFPLVVISAIASLLVFVFRYRVLEQGVALGYSSAVITPAMGGGALLFGGLFALGVTGNVSANLDHVFPRTRDAQEITGLPAGSVAAVAASEILWSEALFCDAARCEPASEPLPGATERWAPLDRRGRAWVAMPAAATSLSSAVGVVRAPVATRDRFPASRELPDEVAVIAIGLEAPPPPPPIFAGATIGGLAALFLGLAISAFALWLAWQET